MATSKTNREFFIEISKGLINEDTKTWALEHITKMNATSEKNRNRPSKARKDNEAALPAIAQLLEEHDLTASDLAIRLGVSIPKATALLKLAVENQIAFVRGEVKSTSKSGGKVKLYERVKTVKEGSSEAEKNEDNIPASTSLNDYEILPEDKPEDEPEDESEFTPNELDPF